MQYEDHMWWSFGSSRLFRFLRYKTIADAKYPTLLEQCNNNNNDNIPCRVDPIFAVGRLLVKSQIGRREFLPEPEEDDFFPETIAVNWEPIKGGLAEPDSGSILIMTVQLFEADISIKYSELN
jgi:hypothetical protein